MRKRTLLAVLVTFGAAGALSVGAATLAVDRIEERSARAVDRALSEQGLAWASVDADGLRVELSGTAPDEATRFRALTAAGSVVDGTRVVDAMDVVQPEPVAAPRFSVEILRASEGVTLIGLVPATTDRERLATRIAEQSGGLPVTDLLEVSRHDAPESWPEALELGLEALSRSEKAKVSITPDRVALTTMAADPGERALLERDLTRLAPDSVTLALDVAVPRPVIAPFVLRLSRSPESTSLVACSAPDAEGRERILTAARDLDIPAPRCRIGLGAPSPDWSRAAAEALAAMHRLETGTLSMSNLDVRIEAGPQVPQFGRVVADLERRLPSEFTLAATQADIEEVAADAGPAEFIATRNPEGLVQMRGRMGTERSGSVVTSFGKALFGSSHVETAIEVSSAVPENWSPRVLAALDGLSIVNNGAVTVDEDDIRISGTSGNPEIQSDLAQLLSGRLGEGADYRIDVRYDERLNRDMTPPTPAECVEQINGILSDRQITFDPGSGTIAPESRDSVDAIGAILRKCDGVAMEVGGHTDSQGSEEMNRQLSQTRAEAVLTALLSLRVPVGDLKAVGYGESTPIADNATEAGREANRRIEFLLLEDDAGADTAQASPDEDVDE